MVLPYTHIHGLKYISGDTNASRVVFPHKHQS